MMKQRQNQIRKTHESVRSPSSADTFRFVYQFQVDAAPQPNQLEKPLFLHLNNHMKKFLQEQSLQAQQSLSLFEQMEAITQKDPS